MTSTLSIDRLGLRGEGVARLGERSVFVPLTLAGETVRAEVEGTRGRLIEVLSASPERGEPFCPHFGSCGGCQLQHMALPAYLDFKRSLVVSALERAGITAEVAAPVVAHGEGRRRAGLHAGKGRAGFMALRSHTIHDLDTCPILVPALRPAARIARALAEALGPCEVALTASAVGLDVAVTAKGARVSGRLAEIARRFDLARLALNGEPAIVMRPPVVRMGRAEVALPVRSFLQATAAAEEALAGMVTAALNGAKAVADLFCGVGPFALRLAETAPVFAADSDGPAVAALDAARRGTQGLKPIAAERRDLFREPLTPFELNRFDAVVLDPPRAGAEAQARELAGSKVRRIGYVSCDPQSLARDAGVLLAGGYRMGPVVPVDQFAWSAHVEAFAVFER